MIVLAFDTSTLCQTVALMDDEQTLSQSVSFVERGHTSTLLKSVDACLKEASMDLREVELLAVGLGPGSFTGLRIGVSSAKTLAFATGIPLVGVSSLAAIAFGRAIAPNALAVTAIDARKKEVYGAIWQLSDAAQPTPVIEPAAFKPSQLTALMNEIERPLVGMGNGFTLYSEEFESALGAKLQCLPSDEGWPRAIAVADMGRARFEAVGPDGAVTLEPLYIRASDAELNWGRKAAKPRRKGEKK